MASDENEFQELLDRLCEGELDSAQQQRLAELLEDSPERQREYLQYLDLHTRMQAEQSTALPPIKSVTLRQMTVEFGEDGMTKFPAPMTHQPRRIAGLKKSTWKGLSVLLLLMLVMVMTSLFVLPALYPVEEGKVLATVQSARPVTLFSAWKPGAELRQGRHQLQEGEVQIELKNKAIITLTGPTSLELITGDIFVVERGNTQVRASQASPQMVMQYGKLSLEGGGADFDLLPTNDPDLIELKVLSGSVTINPHRWLPKHLWDFEDKGRQVIDKYGIAHGQLSSGTKRVPGLVGEGNAIDFDNTANAAIAVGSGGGEALGTGSFAVYDGITLEAFIFPRWTGNGFSTGDEKDYDEILRKDGDGELRFLLSFQNDDPSLNNYSYPKQNPGPVLAFGLYLVGQGYQELEVPLEGENAPVLLNELKNGKPHHVAATYRTSTGLKQIYIDGKRVASHQYPVGTRPLTGGPGEVVIGNLKPPGEGAHEAFDGILDDVAFYDFALTAPEVKRHADDREVDPEGEYFRFSKSYEYSVPVGSQFIDLTTGLPVGSSEAQSETISPGEE
ncbi:MAG: LamG domain-containing protein [Planctomycetaceae bacterium]|nr:LamG domain-containing protein [Planctomycetaceae bacterium]